MSCATHRTHLAGCEPCQRYARFYVARRALAVAAGTWQYPVPAGELRAHLDKLLAAPMTQREISRCSGVTTHVIAAVLAGRRVYVQGPYAHALLAVQPVRGPRYAGMVEATTTVRQLRAMQVIGCSHAMLHADTGLSTNSTTKLLAGRCEWVTPDVAARVDAAYDRARAMLADNWPHPTVAGADVRTVRNAARKGWAGPDMWSDDTIGDPSARPAPAPAPRRTDYLRSNVDDALDGRVAYRDLTTAELIEVVTVLAARGWTDRRVGEWLSWPASPEDRPQQHSPVQRFRRYHGIAAGHRSARAYAEADARACTAA